MPSTPQQALPGHGLDASVDALVGGVPGTVSVWCGDLTGRAWYVRAADVPHYAASTMKLPLLVAAYRRHERGELDLDRPVPVHNRFSSARDGSPFSLDPAEDPDAATWARLGDEVSLRELARRAVVRSGNLATNLLLEHVGSAEVGSLLADAGCTPATVLPRGIEDTAARAAGQDNRVTAADLARVMAALASGRLAGEEASRAAEEVLAAQEHRDKIVAGLPAGTYVANKTGWVTGVAHDVALVRPSDRPAFVLAVCTSTGLDDAEASRLVAAITAALWPESVA